MLCQLEKALESLDFCCGMSLADYVPEEDGSEHVLMKVFYFPFMYFLQKLDNFISSV